MSEIAVGGKKVRISGNLPDVGSVAPDFLLVGTELRDVRLSEFKGSMVIMNIFQSVDQPVCAETVRRFNEMADRLDNTKVLCISKDLPFAHERFNTAEGIDNVISLCELRNNDFGNDYGLRIEEGSWAGLFARAVLVLDENLRVVYTQTVPDTMDEPDYESASQTIADATVESTAGLSEQSKSEAMDENYCVKKPTGEHARLEDDDDCDESRAGKI